MLQEPTNNQWTVIVDELFGPEYAQKGQIATLEAWRKHYCNVVCPASATGDTILSLDTPAIQSHEDVCRCLRAITQKPSVTFEEFICKAIGDDVGGTQPSEQRNIARLITRAAYSIDCSPVGWTHAGPPMIWSNSVSFLDFIKATFPLATSPPVLGLRRDFAKRLKAWKLTSRTGITLEGTDDLSQHLLLDKKTLTLRVFHHVSFLWAHLEKSKDDPLGLDFEQSLMKYVYCLLFVE